LDTGFRVTKLEPLGILWPGTEILSAGEHEAATEYEDDEA
jgi:hypothetical protein